MPVVREYEAITLRDFSPEEIEQLKKFALENTHDVAGNSRAVLSIENGILKTQNYVGILETKGGTTLEILPKIDLEGLPNGTGQDDRNREIFLQMLRTWRGMNKEAQFNSASIRKLHNFPMLEIFVRIFLENLMLLTQRGLARHYHSVEANLPVLRGRLLFPQHIRANISNRARFHVEYDEFSADRSANRLIHSTLQLLMSSARHPQNQQLLQQLLVCFADIPRSRNLRDDWDKHRLDRSMPHYSPVMQWVGVFLFQQGLVTFSGDHLNRAWLFPMEQIYEDYVSHAFKHNQNKFEVSLQKEECFARMDGGRKFTMKPDICLLDRNGNVQFILDAKWKQLQDLHKDISQSDLYQLYAYGKTYGCEKLALVYPRTANFTEPKKIRLNGELDLLCIPFDVTNLQTSVEKTLKSIT